MPVTRTGSSHGFASARVSPGRIPIVVPPAPLAPRAAAAITSPSPPVTTVVARSASSRPTSSAFASCASPLPMTETCTMQQSVEERDVLILGGGFAGAYVGRLPRRRRATIISPENFMLYTPFLPEAASGTLEPRHTVVPLREMCPDAELLLGRADALDLEAHTATTGGRTLRWGDLVIALGAVPRT